MLNENFEWPDGSYSEKHETVTDYPPTRIYENEMENKSAFSIKTGYYPEFLMFEVVKLFGNTKSKMSKDENVPHLELLKYW